METSAADLLSILDGGKASVVHYLKRLHNLALKPGWLSIPVLAPILWPNLPGKPKRGITMVEHQLILAAEKNPERNLFYRLLWEIGSSQSDAAKLTAENIDWPSRTLTYFRMKTGEKAQLTIRKKLELILDQLPTVGSLFPKISATTDNARSAEFYRRCKLFWGFWCMTATLPSTGFIDPAICWTNLIRLWIILAIRWMTTPEIACGEIPTSCSPCA